MPVSTSTHTQLANLRRQFTRAVETARQQMQAQTNSVRGISPIVTYEAARNRVLQTGGQSLLNQINRLQANATQQGTRRNRVVGVTRPETVDPNDAGTSLKDLAQQYQDALTKANEANEARYQDVLGGFRGLREDITGRFENRERQFAEGIGGYGNAARARVNTQFDRLGASAQQDLVTRGLTGSTILPSVRTGIERERATALADLDEQIQRLRLGQQSQLSGDTANAISQLGQAQFGFQERRTDQAPDFSQLAQLAQALGLGNNGQGFAQQTQPAAAPSAQPQTLGRQRPAFGIPAPRAGDILANSFPGGFIPGITGNLQGPQDPALGLGQALGYQQQAVELQRMRARQRNPNNQLNQLIYSGHQANQGIHSLFGGR